MALELLSFHEGKSCPTCGAILKVVEVTPTTIPSGDRLLASSTYECAGLEAHRWAERIDLDMSNGTARNIRLIPWSA